MRRAGSQQCGLAGFFPIHRDVSRRGLTPGTPVIMEAFQVLPRKQRAMRVLSPLLPDRAGQPRSTLMLIAPRAAVIVKRKGSPPLVRM